MNNNKYSKIFIELGVLINSIGYVCIGSELIKSDGVNVLRVYLDVPGGVDISDCEKVSRGISEYLDSVESLLPEKYFLEVSSPGVERPLFTVEDYQKFIGKEVEISLKERKKVVGVIVSVSAPNSVKLLCQKEEREILFADIRRAKLLFKSEYGQKKTFKKIPPKKKKK